MGITKPPVGSQINWGHPLSRGLVGCWLMNEGGGKIARDIANNLNGSLVNTIWKSSTKGYSTSFDGAGDYITCGDTNLVKTTKLTFSVWAYHNSATTDQVMIGKVINASGPANGFLFLRDDVGGDSGRTDCYKIYIEDTTSAGEGYGLESATNSGSAGVWRHVVATVELGSTDGLKLYINGIKDPNGPINTTNCDSIISTAPLVFGVGENANRYMDGMLSNIQIWNRVLSPSEIRQLYIEPYCFITSKKTIIYYPSGAINPDASVDAIALPISLISQIPSVTAQRNVSVSAITLTSSLNLQIPTVTTTSSVDATVNAIVLSTKLLAQLPTVSTQVNVSVSAITIPSSFVAQIPTVTTTTVGNALVDAPAITTSVNVQLPTITAIKNASVSAITLPASLNVQIPSVTAIKNASVSGVTIAISWNLGMPTVTATSGAISVSVSATTLDLALLLLMPVVSSGNPSLIGEVILKRSQIEKTIRGQSRIENRLIKQSRIQKEILLESEI